MRSRLCGWLIIAILLPVACAAQNLPDSVLGEVKMRAQLPRGTYTEARTWSAAGTLAGHNLGHSVADSGASDGLAWEAKPGVDTTTGPMMLYGPYLDFPAGEYVALFRMKLLENAGEEPIADVDAAAQYGQDILSMRELTGSDLAAGRWVRVPLAFRHPGGKLECRVAWRGQTGIRVDTVSLYRVTGAAFDPNVGRAPQPTPTGQPKNLVPGQERRPFPDIFPRSNPPASTLLVVDLQKESPDRRMLAETLQGIVNRKQPRIYCLFNATDQFWLDWMLKNGWVKRAVRAQRIEDALARFSNEVQGVVITDPALPASKNVATMLASVRNGVVVTPRLAGELHLLVLENLRGRWQTSVEAYRWAFDNLWPQLNHHVIACSYPDHLGLRDYLVANRVFIFWLSGPLDGARPYANPQAEVRLMEQLLAKMPANIPVMGYPWAGKDIGIGEGPGVTLFAEFGKYLVGSIDCSNLSVHSGIRVSLARKPAPPAPRMDRRKVYVSWVISDGDNLPVLTTSNFPQLWKEPLRGRFPIGWTASPSSGILIPDIMRYYYSTSSRNDDWMAAVSGIGYTYPDSYGKRFRAPYRARVFDGFLAQTATYMAPMGLWNIWPMGITRDDLIARYAERIPQLKAIFPDYGRRVSGYEDATYPTARNVPVFHALTSWAENMPREQQIRSLVTQIRNSTPRARPAFMHLFVLNWFSDLPILEEVLKRLGPDYVCVRPDHLAALYKQELATAKALVRVPPVVSAISGQPLVFSASIQNVTSQPMSVRVSVTGIRGGSVSPTQLHLAPAQTAAVRISGVPASDSARIQVTGGFGTRTSDVTLRTVPGKEIVGSLPKGATLRFVRRFEAEDLAHRSGQLKMDPAANAGAVWSAMPHVTEPGWIVYGPYMPLKPGRYVALFRLRQPLREGENGRTGEGETVEWQLTPSAQGPTPDSVLVRIDTCTNGGQRSTSEKTIMLSSTPVGEFRSYPLVFTQSGPELETRAFWPGAAPVEIDSVDLFEIIRR